MSGRWASPSFEISENNERQFVVTDLNRKKWLATFLMFQDARNFVTSRMHTDSLDMAAKALEQMPVHSGGDWGTEPAKCTHGMSSRSRCSTCNGY